MVVLAAGALLVSASVDGALLAAKDFRPLDSLAADRQYVWAIWLIGLIRKHIHMIFNIV